MTEKFWDERMAERQGELDRAATELTQLVKETFKEALHDLGGVALEGEKLGREIAELRDSLAGGQRGQRRSGRFPGAGCMALKAP